MITELTPRGVVTRPMTARERRSRAAQRARWARQDQQRKADAEAGRAWYTAFLAAGGLTLDDDKVLPGLPGLPELVKSLSWRTGDDRERVEWLLRQYVLVTLELRARHWRIGKRLYGKVLAATERVMAPEDGS
jgi:hypothetical protein